MGKGEETYKKNLVENPFFHPSGYNCTLRISCKTQTDKQIEVILFVYVSHKKRLKIYIRCPPVAEMTAVMPLEALVRITIRARNVMNLLGGLFVGFLFVFSYIELSSYIYRQFNHTVDPL